MSSESWRRQAPVKLELWPHNSLLAKTYAAPCGRRRRNFKGFLLPQGAIGRILFSAVRKIEQKEAGYIFSQNSRVIIVPLNFT